MYQERNYKTIDTTTGRNTNAPKRPHPGGIEAFREQLRLMEQAEKKEAEAWEQSYPHLAAVASLRADSFRIALEALEVHCPESRKPADPWAGWDTDTGEE